MPEASTGPTAPAARADEAPRSMAASARIAIAAKLRNRCAAPRFERVLIVSGSPPCRGRGNSSVERRPLEKVSPLRTCREATVLAVRPTSEQRDVASANVLQKKTAAVSRGQAGSRRASWSDHLRRRRFTCCEATVLLVRPTLEQRDVASANVLQKKTVAVIRGQAGS